MRKILLIRIILTIIIGAMVMAATARSLRPRASAQTEARFMHCDLCQLELVFNPTLAGGHCPRCNPPKVGTLVATRNSLHEGNPNPWRLLNIVLSFETMLVLGAVVYLLHHPPQPRDAGYLYTNCPNCGRRLRYLADRAGQAGSCPLCKAMFPYPALADESDSLRD